MKASRGAIAMRRSIQTDTVTLDEDAGRRIAALLDVLVAVRCARSAVLIAIDRLADGVDIVPLA